MTPEYWDICYYLDACEDQQDFLIMAARYQSHKGSEYKDWLYKLGRDSNLLKLSYSDFLAELDKGSLDLYRQKYGPYRRRRYYSWRRDRKQTKYVKNTSHKKKKEKNNNKQAWREHKKFNKDKSKNSYYKYWFTDKSLAPKRHRVWTKQKLHQEDWDVFGDYNEYKQFYTWS